jgi:hypothetical protein
LWAFFIHKEKDMDLSWIAELAPIQIATFVIGITILLALAKQLGLSVSKNGLSFKAAKKTDTILETVKEIKESNDRQEIEIKRLGDEVNKNTKDTLRLTFYNDILPPAERLVAGKRYLAAGGNGETERAINGLAQKHPDVWEGILAVAKGEDHGD